MAKKKIVQSTHKKSAKNSSSVSLNSKLYWKIYRAGAEEALNQGIELSAFEKRALASEIKGNLKSTSSKKISNNLIRSTALFLLLDDEAFDQPDLSLPQPDKKKEKKEPESNFFNPILLQTQDIAGIPWFEINDFVSITLSSLTMGKDLRIIVDAGIELGRLDFNLKQYDYEGTGLRDLVERIREQFQNQSDPDFNGIAVVRPGFKDDGKTDSYALKMVLFSGTGPIGDLTEASAPIELNDEQERVREIGLEIAKQEKLKPSEAEMRKKRERKRPRKKEEPEPTPTSKKGKAKKEKPTSEKQELAKLRIKLINEFNRAKQLARKDFDDKILSAKEYKSKVNRLDKQMEKELNKMKNGGIVK